MVINFKIINSYLNPFSKTFQKAAAEFKFLSWPKKILTICLSILSGLGTVFALGTGGFATFRVLVEKFNIKKVKTGENPVADKVSQVGKTGLGPETKTQTESQVDSTTEIQKEGKESPALQSSIKRILNVSDNHKIQDDYFFRFKRHLKENFLIDKETRLNNQLVVLADAVYVGMKKGENVDSKLQDLEAFLANPVAWTKSNGAGPAAFYSPEERASYVNQYGEAYVASQSVAWKKVVETLEPRANNMDSLSSVCSLTFDEIKGPLKENLDAISAESLWSLKKDEEQIYSDFAFYNKETDYITFEHVKKRALYFGDIEFERTYAIQKTLPDKWKFCLFVKKEDLGKAWNILRPILFSDHSPVESGKIAKPENDVAQIVLYTFADSLDPDQWKATLKATEEALSTQGVNPLSDEDKRPKRLFDNPEKYQLILGGRFCHYTLERYKIRPDEQGVDGKKETVPVSGGGGRVEVGYEAESGFYSITESDYARLPIHQKANPANIPNPFEHMNLG